MKRSVIIDLFLFTFVMGMSTCPPAMAQECRGPNLTLTIADVKGEITDLDCANFGSADLLYMMTESKNRLEVKVNAIKKISIVRNNEGNLIALRDISPTYILATLEVQNGLSREIYVQADGSIVGNSPFGKQTFYFRNIQSVQCQ